MTDRAYNVLGAVAGILAASLAFIYIAVTEFHVR